MEQHHDEHIVCADCGESFLFSAGEAAVFLSRGLLAPKRCKECRRIRKERGASQGGGGGRDSRGPSSGGFGGRGGFAQAQDRGYGPPHDRGYGQSQDRGFGGPPRGGDARGFGGDSRNGGGGFGRNPRGRQYTGDVNEYRSPMQDPSWSSGNAWGGGGNGHGNHGGQGSGGGYGGGRVGGPPQREQGRFRSAPPGDQNERRGSHPGGPVRQELHAGNGAPRRREAEAFSITCNACGSKAEVPFKPAEGRDVFCQACYRARKPV